MGDVTQPSLDLVVTSPGWRPDQPLLAAAAAAAIPVWGEVELAWRLRPREGAAPWLTVTGTNGKTTTVQMLASILRAAVAPEGPKRRPTRPSAGARQRRLDAKRHRSEIKSGRRHWTDPGN